MFEGVCSLTFYMHVTVRYITGNQKNSLERVNFINVSESQIKDKSNY